MDDLLRALERLRTRCPCCPQYVHVLPTFEQSEHFGWRMSHRVFFLRHSLQARRDKGLPEEFIEHGM